MQHDDVIWSSLHKHFCSYKVSAVRQKFCRNKYNLTGLCERKSCPLANSRYATIVENDGRLYLFVKTAERAHSPRNLWERIKLSQNYRSALAQIDKHLEYWPKFYVHKAKQRLTKMTQYLIRKRRLALRSKTRLVGIKKKIDRREAGREKKAVNAAKLEASIEKELLERLRTGAYGDIYNFAQDEYEKVLDSQMDDEIEIEDEEEDMEADEYEAEYEEDSEEDLEQDIEESGSEERFDFDDGSDGVDDSSEEEGNLRDAEQLKRDVRERARKRVKSKRDSLDKKGAKGKRLRRPRGGVRVEVEFEHEAEVEQQTR